MQDKASTSIRRESERSPILLVFLRHLGCTFARKALRDLRDQHGDIAAAGARIIVVVMSSPGAHDEVLRRFGWEGMEVIRDPEQQLYQEFSVPRGTLAQVLPPAALIEGLHLAVACGIGIGRPHGDCMQLGAVFLLENGRILQAARHRTSGEQTRFLDFVVRGLSAARPRRLIGTNTITR